MKAVPGDLRDGTSVQADCAFAIEITLEAGRIVMDSYGRECRVDCRSWCSLDDNAGGNSMATLMNVTLVVAAESPRVQRKRDSNNPVIRLRHVPVVAGVVVLVVAATELTAPPPRPVA